MTDFPRCKTCAYWLPLDEYYSEGKANFAKCSAVPAFTSIETNPVRLKVVLAVVVDYEEYMAKLMTKAEFGCVLHTTSTTP